ncbi:MAG: FxLYD domain-containing protein [Halomonas sp.]|uniref:FxLYD domain-containing protein n=1 Tax=Halomonas sp. TaxID=1486246 RepID=UPI003F90EAB1
MTRMFSIFLLSAISFVSPAIADEDLLRVENTEVIALDSGHGHEIVGVAHSTTDEMISAATLTFNLYDRSGAKVGEARANGNHIEPGVPWRFRALFSESSVTSYRLVNIRAF